MPDARILGGEPHAAVAADQRALELRPHAAPGEVAVQGHDGAALLVHPGQTHRSPHPERAIAVEQDRPENHRVTGNPQRVQRPAAIAVVHAAAGDRADPQVAVATEYQALHVIGPQGLRGQPREALAGPARNPGIGTHPQSAVRRQFQRRDHAPGQAGRVAGLGQELLDAAIGMPAVQARARGTDPQRAVGSMQHVPDRAGGQIHLADAGVMDEMAAVRAEFDQPGRFGADPHAVGTVDVDAIDLVVAQPVLAAPDAETDAVVTRQPVQGGKPQVAVGILGHVVHGVGRQAVSHRQLAGQRGFGQAGPCRRRRRGQPHRHAHQRAAGPSRKSGHRRMHPHRRPRPVLVGIQGSGRNPRNAPLRAQATYSGHRRT